MDSIIFPANQNFIFKATRWRHHGSWLCSTRRSFVSRAHRHSHNIFHWCGDFIRKLSDGKIILIDLYIFFLFFFLSFSFINRATFLVSLWLTIAVLLAHESAYKLTQINQRSLLLLELLQAALDHLVWESFLLFRLFALFLLIHCSSSRIQRWTNDLKANSNWNHHGNNWSCNLYRCRHPPGDLPQEIIAQLFQVLKKSLYIIIIINNIIMLISSRWSTHILFSISSSFFLTVMFCSS